MMMWRILIVLAVLSAGCHEGTTVPPPAEPASSAGAPIEIMLSPSEQAAAEIETRAVEASDQPELLRVSGRIALADDRIWRVGVRTNGLVDSVLVGVGDRVQKGQVLARYHADEVRDSRARYRAAAVELSRAEGAAALAQRNADRSQTLLGMKAASIQQVEQARQDALTAQSAVRSAQIEVERLRSVLEDELRVPASPVAGDETADQVPILAPAAGYILEKEVTPGRAVGPPADTFVIGDLSEVWMLASVRQDQLGRLRIGEQAIVTLPGAPDRHITGTIANLGQTLDPMTRVMSVRIQLRNPGNELRPEMLASAEIPISRGRPRPAVSSDALQQVNGQDVVFVRSAPDRFAMRPVRVGATADGQTQIADGVTAGEQVVVRGSFALKSQLLRAAIAGN